MNSIHEKKSKRATNKRLTIFSETEQSIIYDVPDFNDEQRLDYLTLTEVEQKLMQGRPNLESKIFCCIQIGYFTAKQLFFQLRWQDIPEEDINFILYKYFSKEISQEIWSQKIIYKKEYYRQRELIAELFAYKTWSKIYLPLLLDYLSNAAKKDISLPFIIAETIAWFKEQQIIRPNYTTLQDIISKALSNERRRLNKLLEEYLDEPGKNQLRTLLTTETLLSDLAALKQDAKNFKYRVMQNERNKLTILRPLYNIAHGLLERLEISSHNVHYYASLANYYTVYELRLLQPEQQTLLYLLCYSWLRYQQLIDNFAEAFCSYVKQFDDDLKHSIRELRLKKQQQQDKQAKNIGKLLGLFLDERFKEDTPYGNVLNEAFAILPKDIISTISKQLAIQETDLDLRWQIFDQKGHKFRKHLRPLFLQLDLSSINSDSPWLRAFQLIKQKFKKQQAFPIYSKLLISLIPKQLYNYFLTTDKKGKKRIIADRYEYWIYRQCRKRLVAGELYLDDSTHYRSLDKELISQELQEAIMPTLKIACLHKPIQDTIKDLTAELHEVWTTFNLKLKQDTFKHLAYDKVAEKLLFKKPKEDKNKLLEHQFYRQLPSCNITDILYFVNERCNFLKAFTPLQPLYSKKTPDQGELFAVIMAQAMNYGIYKMADVSDIEYHTLSFNLHQYFRLSTLKASNDILSNTIADLEIFPYFSKGFDKIYACLDGQKFETSRPTSKARYSRKYFGKGRGVVAYTLLCNHIPVQTQLIGAHEHESYNVFDIIYNNTTNIIPEAISGDMRSINKANFGILNWFNYDFNPRFTNLSGELEHLYCGYEESYYKNNLVKPVGKIDDRLIEKEWPRLQRIIVTLAQKEISQSLLIKKLCTYSNSNQTRKALFEYDKLVRSIYTLKYITSPELQRQVQRSQNRVESYHQLRAAIAQINGKKQLTGKTDLEIEISNECGRLIANAIIYYNAALLTKLLEKYEAENDIKGLELLEKISPVAYQHIHLLGHYAFGEVAAIDLQTMIDKIELKK